MEHKSRQEVSSMNDEVLLYQLQELTEKLGISVRYENLNLEESSGRGGICRINGEHVLIIHSKATVKEQIHVVVEALKRFDLGDIYVKPVLREIFDGPGE